MSGGKRQFPGRKTRNIIYYIYVRKEEKRVSSHLHFLIQSVVPQTVSYYQSNFGGLETVYQLHGYSHSVLERILQGICDRAEQEGIPVQVIHHCLDNSVQGILLPGRSAGVYGIDAYDPNTFTVLSMLRPEELLAIKENLEEAGKLYRKARAIHDEQEKIYIGNMDFEAADRLTEETIDHLLGGKGTAHTGSGTHRFFGAATVNGSINYIPEVTQALERRYFIKGRPGTGKSTFLKKLARAAMARGFDTEIYHCSLDPKSLDLVAVRELGFCLFDSTAPHEYFPTRQGDEIIDIYEKCVTPGTDEKYREELDRLQKTYKGMLLNAAVYLKNVKKACDRLEASLPSLSKAEEEDIAQQLIKKLC